MMSAPIAARLSGERLHLRHGPIDLVIKADGVRAEVETAYAAAWSAFQNVLPALVEELALLRQPLSGTPPPVEGPVARRMVAACWPYRDVFITPMAAVAGSVAEEILAAMIAAATLSRALVNNGGDIAIYLAGGECTTIGVVDRPDKPRLAGTLQLASTDRVGGVATSGWRGRSQSLGIADAVTVLAATAAQADAAATIIANAVDADHPAIRRLPARAVKHDSDLGDRLVTVAVGDLPDGIVQFALDQGAASANTCRRRGLIAGAVLQLAGQVRVVGTVGRMIAPAQTIRQQEVAVV